MRDAPTRMDITPELIDLGDRVIQLGQVTSARVGTVHPWRHAARYPLIAAVILLAASFARGGGLVADGLGMATLLALALALGLFLYPLQRLVIATSDGERVLVRGGDLAFLRLVLDRIRRAMEASDPGFRSAIDLAAQTIDAADTHDAPLDALPTLRSGPEEMSAPQPMRRPEPELRASFDAPAEPLPRDTLSPPIDRLAGPPRTSLAERRQVAPDRESRGSNAALAEPVPQAGIETVITLIDHAELPHKSEIRALLDPVRDHLAGGRTGRGDARRNWKLFHDYARQYLTDVDGLAEACDRMDGAIR